LSNLNSGPHFVEVVGKRDSGFYQDDPAFGADATITRSRTWTVESQAPLRITEPGIVGTNFTLHFIAEAGRTYSVQFKDSVDDSAWSKAIDVPAQTTTADYAVTNLPVVGVSRFYQVVTPAQP
jgi:hypothetical protein